MNRHLSAAVLATFRDAGAAHHREQLLRYSSREWQQNFHWLDASGLALYFLQRLKALQIGDAIPPQVLLQLEQRQADNRLRTTSLFNEFVRINKAFQDAGLPYVNLKGFTLVPDYCPDLSLRYQMDTDFLIDPTDAETCREILVGLGYFMTAANSYVMEFKADMGNIPHMRDLYKPKPQSSVEVHFCDAARSDLHCLVLGRSQTLAANGSLYPALSPEDMFLAQASHLFRHVRSEWTRASWLLEFKQFVMSRHEDAAFWERVRLQATETPGASVAVGVAVSLSQEAFGQFAPGALLEWSVATLPRQVALWIESYGSKILLTDFPGSKLYLILERELSDGHEVSRTIRRRIFPLHNPTRVAAAPAGSVVQRLTAALHQWRYFFFRLRFHLTQSSRYLLEDRRWKRQLKHLCAQRLHRHADCTAHASD